MFSQKGNASLEAALSLPVIFAALVFLFLAFYGVYLQASLQHQSDEYLLCAEFSNENSCQQNLRNNLHATLPLGKWQVIVPAASSSQRQIQIQFSLHTKGLPEWSWLFKNQIKRDSLSSFL